MTLREELDAQKAALTTKLTALETLYTEHAEDLDKTVETMVQEARDKAAAFIAKVEAKVAAIREKL